AAIYWDQVQGLKAEVMENLTIIDKWTTERTGDFCENKNNDHYR
ncbi:19014_t:CDS:2, partial [Funneliformis geosporum]